MGSSAGTGDLLALSQPASTGSDWESHYYLYDGNGSVMGLLAGGSYGSVLVDTEVASYRYDPFGGQLQNEGENLIDQPWRHASQQWHERSGLVLYYFRAYDPSLGRWLNRDPIQEAGGLNLYAFTHNDPVNCWDLLGLWTPLSIPGGGFGSIAYEAGRAEFIATHLSGNTDLVAQAIDAMNRKAVTLSKDPCLGNKDGGGMAQEQDRDRKKRCDEIVSSLSKWGNLRATGVYDGHTWVDINNATRYMSSGKNIDNLAAAFGDSVAAEFTEILNAAMGLADPLAGYISSSGGYSLALEGGSRTDAAVSLVGTVSGGVQTADFLHKLYNGTSLLTPTASAGVRFAGWVGVAYTVGKVGYGTYTRYEPNPMLRVTTPATPAQQGESLKFLAEMTDPMMNSLSEAYRENNCQDFY